MYSPISDGCLQHRQYWEAKLTLPINHPFWEDHHPGDRWNCKCRLKQTDEPVNDYVIKDFYPVAPQAGLDNNPGVDGKLFNDTHPYFKSDCKACPFYISKKGFQNASSNCYMCQGIASGIPQSEATLVYNERKRLLTDSSIPIYDSQQNFTNLHTGKILLKKKPLHRLLNHCHTLEELNAAIYLWKNPQIVVYKKASPLGNGKNLEDPAVLKNIQKRQIVVLSLTTLTVLLIMVINGKLNLKSISKVLNSFTTS